LPRSLCLSPYKTLIDNNIDNLDKLLNDIAKEYINVSELTMYGDTKFNKSIDIITKVHSEKRN